MADDLEELPGVGPATAEALVEAGFDSYQGIAVASPNELTRLVDIRKDTAADVIKYARENAEIDGFGSGESALSRRQGVDHLQTGHEGFDNLLGGGIETQSITEVYGNEGAGRTSLAHHLAVRAQLPDDHGGLSGQVAYFDVRNRFDPDRISEIVGALSEEEQSALAGEFDGAGNDVKSLSEAVLEHIHLSSPSNSNEQLLNAEELEDLGDELSDTEKPLGLVVVDSLTLHFRAEYQGRGELAKRQQRLNKHLHDLLRVGDLYNAAVVVTNATTNSSKAYGGSILGHTVTTRLQFKKTSGEVRYAEVVDSPNSTTGEDVKFYFTDGRFTEESP